MKRHLKSLMASVVDHPKSALSGVIVSILLIIFGIHYDAEMYGFDPKETLRDLHNPDSPFEVVFWIDEEGKTQFKQNDRITIYYKVVSKFEDALLYVNLVNISAADNMQPLIQSVPICANHFYSVPTLRDVGCPENMAKVEKRVTLQHQGKEYFKLIVTSEPIKWKTMLEDLRKKTFQLESWATAELKVTVEE